MFGTSPMLHPAVPQRSAGVPTPCVYFRHNDMGRSLIHINNPPALSRRFRGQRTHSWAADNRSPPQSTATTVELENTPSTRGCGAIRAKRHEPTTSHASGDFVTRLAGGPGRIGRAARHTDIARSVGAVPPKLQPEPDAVRHVAPVSVVAVEAAHGAFKRWSCVLGGSSCKYESLVLRFFVCLLLGSVPRVTTLTGVRPSPAENVAT